MSAKRGSDGALEDDVAKRLRCDTQDENPGAAYARATWAMYATMPPEQQATFARRVASALYSESSDDDEDSAFEEAEEELRGRYGMLTREEYYDILRRLPPGWRATPVAGQHKKPCSDCGKSDWDTGELYFTDFSQPWGAEKLCESCIQGWLAENGVKLSEDEDEEGEVDDDDDNGDDDEGDGDEDDDEVMPLKGEAEEQE